MTRTTSSFEPLVDGFSGFPIETRASDSSSSRSISWLLDAVERHASAERDALDQYAQIGTLSGDPVIALVMRLILEDEERHHGLLKRMEATLTDALNWTHSPDALPKSGIPQPPVAKALAAAAHALIEEERTGARYLRDLAHREKDIDAGLHSLLLEMMSMDSEKHARLLQFVQKRLAARACADDGPSD